MYHDDRFKGDAVAGGGGPRKSADIAHAFVFLFLFFAWSVRPYTRPPVRRLWGVFHRSNFLWLVFVKIKLTETKNRKKLNCPANSQGTEHVLLTYPFAFFFPHAIEFMARRDLQNCMLIFAGFFSPTNTHVHFILSIMQELKLKSIRFVAFLLTLNFVRCLKQFRNKKSKKYSP